ncbi:MAG: alpha/beta fold hydrolase [Rhodospirillales bacterium]|nr:alpha/beta fold hydrolase [Rhodospirillales bacterium]
MTLGCTLVTDAGDGAPWLTLVHGMAQDHRVFAPQVEAFRDSYRLLLVDLPGHGRARTIPGPYGHLEMMAHLRNVLDQTEIGPTHFWATHTGTAVGLLLAVREPERFRSLILEGAVISGFAMPYVQETLATAAATARQRGVGAALRDVFYRAAWCDVMRANPNTCRAEAHWQILKDFSGAPWTEAHSPAPASITDAALAAMQIPTLVYNGEQDLTDFMAVASHLEAVLPDVERASIARAGGFPAWEYPVEVNAVVKSFLHRRF